MKQLEYINKKKSNRQFRNRNVQDIRYWEYVRNSRLKEKHRLSEFEGRS